MDASQSKQIEELYRQYIHSLITCAYRLLGNWEYAREAAQETFRIACEKPNELLSSPNPVGWLKITTKNVSRNIKKKQQESAKLLISLEVLYDKDVPYTEAPLFDSIEEFQGITDPESIELLEQIFLKGHSYQTVAAKHGISLWACYKRVQRIVSKSKNK